MEVPIEVKLNEKFLDKISLGDLELYTYPEVFTFGRVDSGTELLLKNLKLKAESYKLLDFGCGSGVMGLSLAKKFLEAEVVCSDVDARAVALTQKNIEANSLGDRVKVIGSNMFDVFPEDEEFDYIITNIPSHLTKQIHQEMIMQIAAHISSGGEFWVVAQRRIKELMKRLLKENFGNYKNIAFDKKYVVMRADID